MSTEASAPRAVDNTPRLRNRSIALAVAVLAAVVVWLIATVAGASLTVDQGAGPQDVTVLAVIVTSALAALLGWGLLAVLERLSAHATTIWTAIAVAVLVLSLVPASLVDASAGTRVALVLMHLAVGAVVILGFRRAGARRA
ncbi:DUF6069 family protein [Micromonospora lupini]|uniref:Uncharacterized protein n=1 Tax=Micromonospora lupini str. Lupac 08 TaxID=1150864 RepID=I0L2B3_9ACTN|nr:DUF6069 family protein [Micromonospora lupini]CCH17960.1 conserved membrane hypothetical protein [Micromonospora lupini str. Lupac 08]